MEPAFHKRAVRAEETTELPLFFAVESAAPIEQPVKSNRASQASKDAGEALNYDSRGNQQRAVLACLGRVPEGRQISRYEIHQRTTIDVSTLCFRLDELEDDGLVEKVERACSSHKKPSLKVTGFRLTAEGRSRVREVSPV